MMLIAIDGACRRNGKPDCVAAGGVFVRNYTDEGVLIRTQTFSDYEVGSTNQRGELLALIRALHVIQDMNKIGPIKKTVQIVTDSEYIFNAMTKEWYRSWSLKGWVTAAGEPVKNSDLWRKISEAYNSVDARTEIVFYHIKGHCIPFGKVTANTLLTKDDTGSEIFAEAAIKYSAVCNTTKKAQLEHANDLSEKNNGFRLDSDTLQLFVVSNVVADAVATRCVDAADALMAQAVTNGS